MPTRIRILLTLFGFLAIAPVTPAAAQDRDSKTKPQVTRSDVEAMMTSLSNWGRWGADDELGTLNLITPA